VDLAESLRQFDIDIFRDLNLAGSNDLLDSLMVAFTLVGISYVIVFLCVPLWLSGKKEATFDLVILVVLVTVVTELVKVLVGRERPNLELAGVHTILSSSGPSFPSAHASRAFAVALLVAMNSRRSYGVIAFIVAALIAVSRVYLGVHWPPDVIFGSLFGLLLAAVFISCEKRSRLYQRVRDSVIRRIGGVDSESHDPSRAAMDNAVRAYALAAGASCDTLTASSGS